MSSEHFYTKYEYWCQCGHPIISWEDTPPVRCTSCNYTGDKWDKCRFETKGDDIGDMRRIINGVERIVKILEGDPYGG